MTERRAWRTDSEWERLRERIVLSEVAPPVRNRPPRWAWATAAVLILAIGAAAVLRATRAPAPETRVFITAAGERTVVHLSDSSVITLAPATTLRFTATKARRDVELDGLAAFHVVHDPSRPFVVHARDAIATDIGTEFVVRAYSTDSVVHVAVTSGEVAIANRAARTATVPLRAGDVGTVGAREATRSAGTNAEMLWSWVDGGLSFDDERLSDVARELSRWFDVDIRVGDSRLAQQRVSALYSNPTLTGVLDALGTTAGFEYAREGRVITLRARTR